MKKIKNIRLMLLGLLVMGGVNAFAADHDVKANGDLRFRVLNEEAATVEFVGVSKESASVIAGEKFDIEIPETIPLLDDAGVNEKDYTVVQINPGWEAAHGTITTGGVNEHWNTANVQNLVKSLTIGIRLNGQATGGMAARYNWDAVTACLTGTSPLNALEVLKVTNAHLIGNIAAIASTTLKVIDFGGVSNDGQKITIAGASGCPALEEVTFPATDPVEVSGFNGLGNLQKVNFGTGKLTIGANAFKGCATGKTDANGNPTAISFTNLDKAISIGANAFEDCAIAAIVIGENVATIGSDAFKSSTGFATSVTYSSKKVKTIPAVFGGQNKIGTITVNSDAVTTIASGAFTDASGKLKLDFTGASALKTITGAFAAAQFTELLLKDAALEGDNLAAIGIDHSNAQGTLKKITFPAKLKGLVISEFQGYQLLTEIDFSNTLISVIPAYAFEGTNLAAITIPVNINAIGDYAFADINNYAWDASGKNTHKPITLTVSAATELGTLGTGVFFNTNISTADFKGTKVYNYPGGLFCKDPDFHKTGAGFITGNETDFLTSVTLADVPAGKKLMIGADAFANNPKLEVENYNQATAGNDAIAAGAFAGTGMKKLDLSATGIVDVPASFSGMTNLEEVTLNENTKTIADNAFAGDVKLKKVYNLNNPKLEKIGSASFKGSKITDLDLSGATSLTFIGANAFEQEYNSSTKKYIPALTTIKFPEEKNAEGATKFAEYTNKISWIGYQAFKGASTVTSIENLKDCKLGVLTEMFTEYTNMYGTDNDDSDILNAPEGLTSIELPTQWKWANGYGETEFYRIADCALQGLGITEITIPGTVSLMGDGALQGCIDLKEVTWVDAELNDLSAASYLFRGDKNLTKFVYMTKDAIVSGGLTDEHFYWCSKAKLTVYVTKESLLQLRADGYTTANAKYSKLNDEIPSTIKFKALANDGYYYATVFDTEYSTWFDETKFEVFSAKINANKVDMIPAKTENGYYKIEIADGLNDEKAVAIVRAKKEVVEAAVDEEGNKTMSLEVLKQAVPGNNKSTLATDNDLQVAWSPSGVTPTKLGFYFKFGKKDGQIGFYRITSGTFAQYTVYIKADDLARPVDFMGLNFGDDATAIQGIEAAASIEDGVEVFNLQGARVNGALKKGVYVKNGKKFIVK